MTSEKQIVFRASRLMRVLNHRCLRSICWVFHFLTSCTCAGKCRSLAPQPSVQYRLIPKGSSSASSWRKTSSDLLSAVYLLQICRIWPSLNCGSHDKRQGAKQPYCFPNNSLGSTLGFLLIMLKKQIYNTTRFRSSTSSFWRSTLNLWTWSARARLRITKCKL